MPDCDALIRAKACIQPARLARAESARLRHERRQIRLQRIIAEREQQRRSLPQDSIARALAKANAAAARADDDDDDQ